MQIIIDPAPLSGRVRIPSSKSYAHRLIIAAALSGGKTEIKISGFSRDINATISAVRALGARVAVCGDTVTVERAANPEGAVAVDCDESGSTLRFLMPVAAALGIKAEFVGAGRLMQRPVAALAECMNAYDKVCDGHKIIGRLLRGEYTLDASESSQYVTGMLFALCALGGGSLKVVGKEVSRGYIDVTSEVLRSFGAEIKRDKNRFIIERGFVAESRKAVAEGDWSNAAFFLAAGAIGGNVSVSGLNVNSRQGDAEIVNILKNFGAKIAVSGDTVTAERGELNGITVDLENVPDLAQIIAVTAAFANGKTVLTSADRLKLKESDRVGAIINTLAEAGIKAEYSKNCGGSITVYGGAPHGGTFDGGKDHRTVMSAAILALYAKGRSAIVGAEAADKSYPNFFGDITAAGGNAYVGF